MSITSWMGLWLEERIKVPERAFDISISLHLFEAHLQKDLDELLTGFHKMMQVAVLNLETLGCWVEPFEFCLLPGVVSNHCTGQFRH